MPRKVISQIGIFLYRARQCRKSPKIFAFNDLGPQTIVRFEFSCRTAESVNVGEELHDLAPRCRPLVLLAGIAT